jgi:hypothetical protein
VFISAPFGQVDDLPMVQLPPDLGVHYAALLLVQLELLVVGAHSWQRLQPVASIELHQAELY